MDGYFIILRNKKRLFRYSKKEFLFQEISDNKINWDEI